MKKLVSLILLTTMILFSGCKTTEEFEPLKTNEEIQEYIEDNFGLVCDESKGYSWELMGEVAGPDEFGYFGYRGTTLWTEPLSIGGQMVFVVRIDPNNGWIQQKYCNKLLYGDCPGENIYRYGNENPDYIKYIDLPVTGYPETRVVGYLTFNECRDKKIFGGN